MSRRISNRRSSERGFSVIEMEWPDRNAIGEAFLFWEIVTAVSSAVMGVNPFDEPNVKESKEATGKFFNFDGTEIRW